MSGPQGERPDYDQTLKRLLLRAHDGFLGLVAPELTWRRELSPELPAESRQADLVWEVALTRADGKVSSTSSFKPRSTATSANVLPTMRCGSGSDIICRCEPS